jgi:hypothetical protein
VGRITLPETKVYHIVTVSNEVWYLQRSKIRSKVQNPEMDSHKYTQQIYDKMEKQFKWRKTKLTFPNQISFFKK